MKKIDTKKFEKGWTFKNDFTDPDGNKYQKGKLIELADGTKFDVPIKVTDYNETIEEKDLVEEPKKDEYLEMLESLRAEINQLKSERISSPIDISGLSEEIAKASHKIEGKPVYETRIDKDDWMDDPVVFSSYGIGYYIFDDKRNGQDVIIPGGKPAEFKFAAGKKVRVGKVETYSAYCIHKEHSRKRAEWLRNHSLYNKEFFENASYALGSNAFTADEAIKISKRIDSWDQSQIIRQCKKNGIKLGGDVQQLKTALHNRLLEDAIRAYRTAREKELTAQLEAQTFEHD
jgi:hypothetical protein